MLHRYGIETGLNPIRLGDTGIKTSFQINNCLELLLSGGANPSLSDSIEELKSKMTLPDSDGSNRHVHRLQILCRII